MNDRNGIEEPGIIISHFFLRLLEQWKGILAVGLLIALLAVGLKAGVSLVTERKGGQEVQDLEEILTDSDSDTTEDLRWQTRVSRALIDYVDWQNIKEYYDNSLLMDLETYKKDRLDLLYYVKSNDENTDINSIAHLYEQMLLDPELAEKMGEAYGVKKDVDLMTELYWFNSIEKEKENGNQKGIVFSITSIIPSGSDSSRIRDAMNDFIESRKDMISKTAGDFELTLVSATDYRVTNLTRTEKQASRFKDLLSRKSDFSQYYTKLPYKERFLTGLIILDGNPQTWAIRFRSRKDEETLVSDILAIFDKNLERIQNGVEESEEDRTKREELQAAVGEADLGLTSEENLIEVRKWIAEEEEEEEEETQGSLEVGKIVKRFVLMLIIGMLLYAGIYFICLVLRHRIKHESDLEDMAGIYSFGSVCTYPYRTPLQKFFHDPKVYFMRTGGGEDDISEAVRIARRIGRKAARLGKSSLLAITMGKESPWAYGIYKKQKEILEKEFGITYKRTVLDKDVKQELEVIDYESFDSVVLIAIDDVTKIDMAFKALKMLKEYDVSVLGSMFLAGK